MKIILSWLAFIALAGLLVLLSEKDLETRRLRQQAIQNQRVAQFAQEQRAKCEKAAWK